MVCDFCGNKATVFFTQLIEGQMKKICLCESCAQEKGVTDPQGFSLADMVFGGKTAPVTKSSAAATTGTAGRKQCPTCGFTLDDLRRVRRFGCSDCYTTFHDEVVSMLRGMHSGAQHVGKVPKHQLERHEYAQRLEQLRARLDQAIAAEHYEEAAGLRDEIRQIEAQGSQAESQSE